MESIGEKEARTDQQTDMERAKEKERTDSHIRKEDVMKLESLLLQLVRNAKSKRNRAERGNGLRYHNPENGDSPTKILQL